MSNHHQATADLGEKVTYDHGFCGALGLEILIAVEVSLVFLQFAMFFYIIRAEFYHSTLFWKQVILWFTIVFGVVLSPGFLVARFVCSPSQPNALLIVFAVANAIRGLPALWEAWWKLDEKKKELAAAILAEHELQSTSDLASTTITPPLPRENSLALPQSTTFSSALPQQRSLDARRTPRWASEP